MKTRISVTIDDLEATAKDDKSGLCFYRHLKIYWDDATNSFSYWYKVNSITRSNAEAHLRKYVKMK